MNIFLSLVVVTNVVTIVVGARALTDEQNALRLRRRSECKSETRVDPTVLDKIRHGEEPDESQVSKYALCRLKKAGLLSESGDLVVDQIKIKVNYASENDEEADKLVEKCAVKKDTPEKTALNFAKCILKSKPHFSPV